MSALKSDDLPVLCGPSQVARYLGVSRGYVYAMIHDGTLRAERPNGKPLGWWRIHREDVLALVHRREP